MALRVPLYPVEHTAPKSTVCVTGGSGYVAGALIQRLLAAGHTVHTTVRNPNKEESIAHLKTLPGAADRLKFFKADLLEPGSFDAGCEYVAHTASPYLGHIPPGKGKEMVIEPAVKGTENVLSAVNKAPTVRRVVVTSSVAAVVANPDQQAPKGHVFNEADWVEGVNEMVLPYFASKRLAEEAAWRIYKEQSRWQLTTLCPAGVWGPPLSKRSDSASVGLMVTLMSGKMWPLAPDFAFGFTDIDDLAAAHCLCLFNEKASGRYIVTSGTLSFAEDGRLLKQEFPNHWLPMRSGLPKWLLLLVGPSIGVTRDMIRMCFGKRPLFDNTKAKTELGMTFMEPKKSLVDMAHALINLGLIKG